MIYNSTGLQAKLTPDAPNGGKRVRPAPRTAPKREEGVWKHVEVVEEHVTCPKVQCKFSSESACAERE